MYFFFTMAGTKWIVKREAPQPGILNLTRRGAKFAPEGRCRRGCLVGAAAEKHLDEVITQDPKLPHSPFGAETCSFAWGFAQLTEDSTAATQALSCHLARRCGRHGGPDR